MKNCRWEKCCQDIHDPLYKKYFKHIGLAKTKHAHARLIITKTQSKHQKTKHDAILRMEMKPVQWKSMTDYARHKQQVKCSLF